MTEINGLYVVFCPDVGENTGGAYCEVYIDQSLDNKIDDFVIHNSIPESKWEECAKGYLDFNGEWLKEQWQNNL